MNLSGERFFYFRRAVNFKRETPPFLIEKIVGESHMR
jgi:hypothetical protein